MQVLAVWSGEETAGSELALGCTALAHIGAPASSSAHPSAAGIRPLSTAQPPTSTPPAPAEQPLREDRAPVFLCLPLLWGKD